MRLSKEDILSAKDVKTEEVSVPEWGGEVLVRGLTGRERDEFEASTMQRRGRMMVPDISNIRAKLACWCMVDEDGQQLFTLSEMNALGEKSGAAINRVYEAAARLSGLSEEDIEEMVEDFGSAGSSASRSSSPANSGSPGPGSSKKQTPAS